MFNEKGIERLCFFYKQNKLMEIYSVLATIFLPLYLKLVQEVRRSGLRNNSRKNGQMLIYRLTE